MIPVYIFTGFLDSGKTTNVRDLVRSMQEADFLRTLLIVCEQGEEEYDADGLSKIGVALRYIDDELSFNDDVITDLLLEVRPERIIVEFNGMWNVSRPKVIWDPEQILEIMMIDASTFENYLGNLKAVIADQIRSADLIIFGRCDEVADSLSMYRRSCRALNRNANIVFRNDDGEISFDPADYLPFDLDAEKIELDDDNFAAFYIDAMENPDRYVGKTVSYSGMILNSRKNGDHSFIAGRIAMTCCSEDLTVFGFICDAEGEHEFASEEWVDICCVMQKEYSEKFELWHPVCKVSSIVPSKEPGKRIIRVT